MGVASRSLVWRRLRKLHEESTQQILWAAGFSPPCSDALCQMALDIGFASATRRGGYIVLKRGPLKLQTGVEDASLDDCVVETVEAYLQRCLLDFARRRDRYVDFCLSCYPLPPATVNAICRRLSLQFALQPQKHNAKTLRVVKGAAVQGVPKPRFQLQRASPRQLLTFPGAAIYIRRHADAQFCCEILRRNGVRVLGVDTEWKPNRDGTDDDHPTALVQLCFKTPDAIKRGSLELPTAKGAEYTCFLLHIVHHGLAPALAKLLSDSGVTKVGVEIAGDVEKLRRHYDVSAASVVELHDAAWERGIFAHGLRSLFQAVVGVDYPKDKAITLSNWETAPLSEQQQDYAACDAYAALRIYETLTDAVHG